MESELTTKIETVAISDGVNVNTKIEYDGVSPLDTHVLLYGDFCITGNTRKEFYEKLGNLVEEYRI